MTTKTELSARGGFTARRNSRIEARKEHKLAKRCSSPVSSGQLDTVSAAATHDQQQLQHEPTATATATTTTATCCSRLNAHQTIYSPMSTTSYLVLATIFLVVTASFPSNTNALPRRMSGRHLILPHRHHVHLRAAMNTPPPKTLGCSMTLESLINAHVTIRQTKGDIAALLSKFLLETRNMSVKNASEFVLYHDLRLSHPLQMEVANKNNDGSDPQSVEEELSKISDTLLILYDLMKKVEIVQPVDVVNQTYGYITSMVHHNLDNTLQMRNMHFDKSSTPSYTYNCSHIFLPYAIINETINVLDVIEKKYNYMLQTCFADAS